MKKSSQVPATLIVSLAAGIAASGCSSTQCVDARGRVLPDSACRSGHYYGSHWITTHGFGGSGSGGWGGAFGG